MFAEQKLNYAELTTHMISAFIERYATIFPQLPSAYPWDITEGLEQIIRELQKYLSGEFEIREGVAVHRSARIEQNVILKAPVIVGANCSIGANAYIRGPVFIDEAVNIGAGCEIKQSVIFSQTAIAHFNYIGNSIIGSRVNFEAGAVAANHYNERKSKLISVVYKNEVIETNVVKFGALVGDDARIGANAVLSPGTLLEAGTIVGRLQLVEQLR